MAPAREPEPEREPLARPKPQPSTANASSVNSISSVVNSAMEASPEREEALSVISSDASPGASVFDLLSAADAAGLALFTPSPQPRRAARSLSIASVNSSPGAAGSRVSSAASSPSQFFRSPVRSRKPRTPASASGRPPTTPSPSARMRVQRARRSRSEATTPVLPLEIRIKEEVVETATPTISSFLSPPRRTGMTPKRPLSTMFRTPSPPSKQPGSSLSRRLKDEFDETELLEADSIRRNSLDSAPDDLFGGSPSGLSGLGDHDSFFSFANSLSPLVHTEELESSFLSVKMSPMASFSSNDLQRLLPPFPANRLNDENDSTKANATSVKPPTDTDDATSLLIASFPNIRASTTATPGKSERSKLQGHSTIKMRLHSPFEPVSSFSTRDLQAINNSLKRKNHGRKRKLEEKKTSTSNVQRKLLQTPVKSSASPMRSPLRPLNGRVAHTSLLSTVGENEEEEKLESSHKVAQQNAQRNLLPTSPTKRKAAEAQENLQPEEKLFVTPARKFQKISVSSRISRGAVCTTTSTIHLAIKQEPSDPAVANASVSTSSNVFQTPAKMFHTPIKLASSAVGVVAPPFIGPTVSKKAPCNCKKSKCLKLYCECFASGGYCDESCNCVGCSNTPAMETERQEAINARLEKNPNAFKPKIEATAVVSNSAAALNAARIMMAGSGTSQLGSEASAFSTPLGTQRYLFGNSSGVKKMHKHGCHCKKSACQKKYCECYQAGVPCGDNCRCIDCKNQAPCVTHPSPAVSTTSAITPSRDIDETFVSPVLQGVRKRLRIDRDTWAKNFSSPFESSPSSLRERTERFRSRLQAVTSGSTPLKTLVAVSSNSSTSSGGAGPLSVRLRPVDSSSTPPPSTPKRVSFAAIRGAVSPLGETASKAPSDDLTTSSKAREMRPKNQVGTSYTKQLDGRGRVIVLPLFGDNLPPLKIAVSAQIFRFLTNADLHNASLVNRLWSQVALGDSVWDHANFIPAGVTDSDHQVDEHHALVVRPSTAK